MPVALHPVVASASHKGYVRRTNQDVWSYSREAGVYIVCDGMGGPAGGEIASRTAVDAFLERVAATPEEQRTPEGIAQAVCAANRRVNARAAHEPALKGMGTTLVALAASGSRELRLAHVGDSRCYRLRQGRFERLTEDHSLVAEQLRMGVIDREQAASSPVRNVITRAVGTARSVEPEVQTIPVESGDLFLLCSDGLTRELEDSFIADLLAFALPLEKRGRLLVEAALEAGGHDNITVLLVAMP